MADLEVRSIVKMFGTVSVLDDVSLRVADGGFTILLGPSGCGKSTLLRIIAGLEQQTSGEVLIGGQSVGGLSPRERDVAMVFQTYALYPHLTVRENMAFGLKMRKEAPEVIETRIQEAADLLDIAGLLDRKPKELSGGQRQRVAMGRAIVRKPKLFLFDEPLSNLDARLRTSMRVELRKLHRRLGATMVYVTHDQVEAMTLGDTIVVMDRGKVRQVGSPALIYNKPADPFVAAFIGSPGMNLLEGSVARQAGSWVFQSGKLALPLPPMKGPLPVEHHSRTVLGIRPEDIVLKPYTSPAISVTGEVEVTENLGADQIVYVLAGSQRIVARIAPGESMPLNGEVTVHFPHERLHLFVDDHRVDWA